MVFEIHHSHRPAVGNQIALPPEGRSSPTPTLQVKDPPRFLNVFKHGKVCVWIHACLIPDNSPLFSAEHITSDTAFAGCPLLPFEIADVLLFPLSFWKGESKMFHCMFPRESGSRFNIYEISQSLLDFLSFSKAVQPTANLWSMAGCRIKDQCI